MVSSMAHAAISILLSFVPVTAFLIALVLLDSYKLVPLRLVLTAVLAGCVAAVVLLYVHPVLMERLRIPSAVFTRYVAPFSEEILKALPLIYLIRRKRIGFMVDGSIYGFAIGAGFAIVENLVYFKILENTNILLWIVRGFGTAIMHGGVTAVVGIVSVSYTSRYGSDRWFVYIPGLAFAVIIHSFFNHFVFSPRLSPLIVLSVVSVTIAIVFRISERRTREWLGVRFDTDAELLEMVNTGKTSESRVGGYLRMLEKRFPGPVVVDMLCMLKIHLELSVKAKGVLMMREAGFTVTPDPTVEAQFRELKYLEKSIGKTGLRAISPMLNMSDKELWELHTLGRR